MRGLAHSLSSISAYKRCEAHLTTKTSHGAIVTVLGVLLGVVLSLHEVSFFLSGGGVAKTTVDLARRHDLGIHIDVTFPAIPCAGLSMDVMDASGSTGNDVSRGKDVTLHKIRLDPSGRRIGGREGEYRTPQSQKLVQDKAGTVMQIDLGAAMSQMSDMEHEMQSHEGCRVIGDISVRRVAGKLHFAVHQQSFVDVLPQMLTGHVLPKLTNMSHVINKVAFGPEFPGQVNPLDGFNRVAREGEALRAYKYFLKIVPTEYLSRMGFRLETNQYSVNEYSLVLSGQPGAAPAAAAANDSSTTVAEPFVDFSYDLSPIMMTVAQSPQDMLHFIVRLCAVVGGVLSITRMADKLVHGLLVATGFVIPPPSIKAKHKNSSTGGYSSGRNSYAGSLMDPLSGPGSGRSSYAGSGVLLPDGAQAAYHRSASGNNYSMPGSHPLSTVTSNGSSLAGMASGPLPPLSTSASFGGSGGGGQFGGALNVVGSAPVSLGGAATGGGSSYGGGNVSPKAQGGFGSLGGFGPAGSGPLYKSGSLGSSHLNPGNAAGAAAVGGANSSRGVSSAGGYGYGGGVSDSGTAGGGGGGLVGQLSGGSRMGSGSFGAVGTSAGGGSMLGGFGSAPLAGVAGNSSGGGGGHVAGVMNSVGSSRLSSASGPGSRTASGPGTQQPLARGLSTMAPGSPLKQQ